MATYSVDTEADTPKLPFDVLWHIVEAAGQSSKPDFQTLCALSATAQTLRVYALKLIYQDILVYDSPRSDDEPFIPYPRTYEVGLDLDKLQLLVAANPQVAQHVRGVRLRWDYEADVVHLATEAVPLLLSFTNVERLAIGRHAYHEALDCSDVPSDVRKAWRKLLSGLPKLQSLRFSGMARIPASWLFLCKKLDRLHLDSSSTFSTKRRGSDERPPIRLKRLQSTLGERAIDPLYAAPDAHTRPIIDITALTHLDLFLSMWQLSLLLPTLKNLLELRLDSWNNNKYIYTPLAFRKVVSSVHPASQAQLRLLSLRWLLYHEVRHVTAPPRLLTVAFPAGLPALETLELHIVLELMDDWDTYESKFLQDLAELDDILLSPEASLFPKLTKFRLAVTTLDGPGGEGEKLVTREDLLQHLPRAAARRGFLEVSLEYATSQDQIPSANDPSTDEDGELSEEEQQ